VFIVSLVPHLPSVSLLVLLYDSLSSNTCHIYLHTSLYLLSLLATNNPLLPTLLSFTFLHVLLLAYYDVTWLSQSSTPHSLTYIPSPSLIPNLLLLAIHILLILFLVYLLQAKLQIYFYFINFWFLLFFSTSTFQSGFLPSLFAFLIFVSSIYFKAW